MVGALSLKHFSDIHNSYQPILRKLDNKLRNNI